MTMAMSTFEEEVYEILSCPVCYKLPRQAPISCCARGHIVCEICSTKLIFCPMCRGALHFNQNTVASQICLIASHKCKYEQMGCLQRLKLGKLEEHESNCPERTMHCPFR